VRQIQVLEVPQSRGLEDGGQGLVRQMAIAKPELRKLFGIRAIGPCRRSGIE
jgi:hypothetical protein